MENKSIWDLISKFAIPQPSNDEQNNSLNENGNDSDKPQENKSQRLNTSDSFLKSYNPFQTSYFDKPQITSKRAERPTRKTIELKNSKNISSLAGGTQNPSIIDLINKHNYYSRKITKNKS